MPITSMKFRGHQCFAKEWSGFDEYRPVNVIIGRNNVGKSQLLDLVRLACKGWPRANESSYELLLRGNLDEATLRQHFPADGYSNDLPGSLWQHGKFFVGVPLVWERDNDSAAKHVQVDETYISPLGQIHPEINEARHNRLINALAKLSTPLSGRAFRHLLADRDIQQEIASNAMNLTENGVGATNVIRRHITSANLQR